MKMGTETGMSVRTGEQTEAGAYAETDMTAQKTAEERTETPKTKGGGTFVKTEPKERGGLRRKTGLCLLAAALCAVLALCYLAGIRHEQARQRTTEPEIPISGETLSETFPRLAATRSDEDTESADAEAIDLSAAEGEYLITEGGKYRLAGSLNGRIRIAAEEQTVHLFLDNVTVTSPEGPALLAESAGKVILTLMEGTDNQFTDSGRYQAFPDTEGCVFSKADLTVNGEGRLKVTGLHKDGIRTSGVMKMLGGQVEILCKRTGIHGSDGIHVFGGSISVSSEKNGFRTTKSGEGGRGNLVISGGDHQIIAGRYAFLVSRADVYVYDCTILNKSVVSLCKAGGTVRIQSRCIR